MSECRKRDAEVAKAGGKGGPKGKAGGKSGAAGGKGPATTPAPLAEVAAADGVGWAGDLLDGAIADAAAEFDEWNFGTALCSLRAETFAAQPPSGKTFYAAPASRRRDSSTVPPRGPGCSSAAPGAQAAAGQFYCTAAASASNKPVRGELVERPTGTYKTFAGGVVASLASGAQTKTQNSFDALSLLTDDAEELLAAVSGEGARGGRVVEAVVDSGAVHSVTPPGVFPGPTVPSPWSRAGRGYRAANGTGIKNLGMVTVKFATAAGDRCSIPFQVAEVEQPLLSVSHLTSAGNRVELGHDSGRVVNLTTGRAIALERRGGVYIMRMYVAEGVAPAPAPFGRQGA